MPRAFLVGQEELITLDYLTISRRPPWYLQLKGLRKGKETGKLRTKGVLSLLASLLFFCRLLLLFLITLLLEIVFCFIPNLNRPEEIFK